MSYDIGDIVTLAVQVKDATGALANATAVAVTVTLPDGSSVGPFTPTNGSTGNYTYAYTPVQTGLHSAYWVATGSNASAYTQEFNVRSSVNPGIVSLDDLKSWLRKSTSVTTDDETLRVVIGMASGIVEGIVGPVMRRTVTEYHDGGSAMISLSAIPVISITSVVESWGSNINYTLNPVTLGVGAQSSFDYTLDPTTGTLTRRAYAQTVPFVNGHRNIAVTFVAGRSPVPDVITGATLIVAQDIWETQRGAQGLPSLGGVDVSSSGNPVGYYNVPGIVQQMLNPYQRPQGIA